MLKVVIIFLLAALLLAQFGCSQKPDGAPRENAPYWVKECLSPLSEWYCGSGASNAEAKGDMVEQIRSTVSSEQSSELKRTKRQQTGEEKSETIIQEDKQKINISTGDIEVAGMERPWTSSNGTVHVAVKKEVLADFYSYKIKSFLTSAYDEFNRAKAYAEGDTNKSALDKVNAIKDTLENNMDSWVKILRIAGGSYNAADTTKKALLLLADSLNRANTAKELVRQLKPMGASLVRFANAVIYEKHPKRKNEAWQKTIDMWRKFVPLLNDLNGLDKEKAAPFEPVRALYARAKEDYQSYCKNQKVYWEDKIEDECSIASFSELSRRIKIEKSKCLNGLKFKFSCIDKCSPISFGVQCSFEPSLEIKSCNEDALYLRLLGDGEPATGIDVNNNKNKAKEELIENFPKSAFFNEWERVIKEWMPQCTE
jgi:hypothetical protein